MIYWGILFSYLSLYSSFHLCLTSLRKGFNKMGRFTCIPTLRCLWKSFWLCWEDTDIKSLYTFKLHSEDTFPDKWKLTGEKEKAKSCKKNQIQDIPEEQSPSRAKIDTEEQGKHMSNRHINIKCRKPREE